MKEKREPSTAQGPVTATAKGAAKSRSKSSTSSKGTASDSKTGATKAKTTKKPVRRKSTGDSSAASRKGTGSKTGLSSTIVTTVVKRVTVEEPPREYKDLMELIDHAIEYDWPSIGQLLGNKADLKLTDEERQLLYGDSPPGSLSSTTKKKTTKTPTKSVSSLDQSPNRKATEDQQQQGAKKTAVEGGMRPGWGRTNVLSARGAWARVRLQELRRQKLEAASPAPVVADGLLTLPTAAPQQQQESVSSANPDANENENTDATASPTANLTSNPEADATTSSTSKPLELNGSWVNEETAEQDKTLAILSESCQIYLKGVLEKAIQCARQRQNLDGIRLWHQQYAHGKGAVVTTASVLSKDNKNKTSDKSKKPPLSLRLGCDISRQVAQAQGNAALTVKRMEEALVRQTGIPRRARELQIDTLCEATSMGDLSWRPLLKQGADKADLQAKRAFEIYGGKEAKNPPLGRVPKKAKLMVEDFVMGSELATNGPYHKAHTASSYISF